MEAAAFVAIALTVITAATPLVFAALGELVVEKSGVLNLGVEGMMLIGAISGFAIATSFDSALSGFLASIAAGIALSLVFAFITQNLRANQVATGLALTLFGTGLAALLGQDFVGQPFPGIPRLAIPVLSEIPIVGPLLFAHDLIVYLSVVMVVGVWWFLFHTRAGMICEPSARVTIQLMRLVTKSSPSVTALSPSAALCADWPALYLSLAYSPMWAENMTAGRGWIASRWSCLVTWHSCGY